MICLHPMMGTAGLRIERTFWLRELRPVSWALTAHVVRIATNA